jgi:hypothetical protein
MSPGNLRIAWSEVGIRPPISLVIGHKSLYYKLEEITTLFYVLYTVETPSEL